MHNASRENLNEQISFSVYPNIMALTTDRSI